MTVNQLIELLRKADPIGEQQVAVFDRLDDYFLEIVDIDVGASGIHIHVVDLNDPPARMDDPSGPLGCQDR